MDARELRGLGEQLAKSILENKNVEAVTFGLTRVLSYLESEQDKRQELAQKIDEHSKTMEKFKEDQLGTSFEIKALKEQSERNSKLLRSVLVAVLSALALEVCKLAFGHIK
jgi:hypothetical protein